jgi:amino acid transporter
LGDPLPTEAASERRLDRLRALAVLSPDALASVAYANQEIFLGLVVAGAAGLSYSWPIAVVITALLAILALSYSQTIAAYPGGGGSYTVARENLGITPGLVAASALMIDYVLNAAVSLTAGVGAVASAFPVLWPYRTPLALLLLLIITLVNLRGLRESGTFMVVPVYLFLIIYLGMIAYGLVATFTQQIGPTPAAVPPGVEPVTLFLLLRTFAAGATALTGVEAISNAVSVFQPPEVRHARQTMAVMATLMGALFLGTIGIIHVLNVVAGPEETILSALARRLFGSGPIYLVIQFVTLLVLVVAANTSFAGFPRVTAVLARDGYIARQLQLFGDRLVYANGIMLLALLAGLLIVLFGGDAHRLIPLFAVGAFLAFTLSQAGMTVHWLRLRGRNWLLKTALNGLGALATGAALIVIGVSKFVQGAWIVVVLIPLIVLAFRQVRDHYDEVGRELRLREVASPLPSRPPRVVVPVAGVHRGVLAALQYACSISDEVTAVYVELNPGSAAHIEERWREQQLDQLATLVVVPSPYRSVVGPFLRYLDSVDARGDGQLASVLIPEFVPAHWWQNVLHNQTAWLLRVALLYRRRRFGSGRAIIDLPFYLER